VKFVAGQRTTGPLPQVRQFFEEALSDQKLAETAADMKEKVTVFDRLRIALRIAECEGKQGLNDDGDDVDMKTIKENVIAFKTFLGEDEKRKTTYTKMIQQIDKYWNKLFADPHHRYRPEWTTDSGPTATDQRHPRTFLSRSQAS
jgi:hypothetical protein